MIRFVGIVAGLGLAAVAAGCGDDGTEPGSDPGQIRVTVTTDGTGAASVPVALFAGSGSEPMAEGSTNATGQVTFAELEAGAYEVEVTVPDGYEMTAGQTARRPVALAAGQTGTVTFALVTPIPDDVRVVTLEATSFSPASVTIDTGMTIRWVNGAAIGHTITPDGHTEWEDQNVSQEGESFEHTFHSSGAYPYLCQIHAGMTGTITVN